MLHYHGGVLHHEAVDLKALAGRCFCVSWAYPEKLALYHQIGSSVCLDNGAFSLYTQGTKVDWNDYYRWIEKPLAHQTTWAIIPDVIDGTDEENDELVEQWPYGDKGAPVWHIPESLERLRRLCDEWPLVCLGISSVEYGRIGSLKWTERMADAMDTACDQEGLPRTKLHMLRGLKFSKGPYPLYSADSASVARSWSGAPGDHKGQSPKDILKMYAQVDACNPPARWRRTQGQQAALFDSDGVDLGTLPEPDMDLDRPPKQIKSTHDQMGMAIPGGARRAWNVDEEVA